MLKYIRFKLFYGIESVIRRRHIFRELTPRRKLLGVVEYADIYCVPRSSNDIQCYYLRATRFFSMTECLIKTKNYQCVNYFMLQFSCACTCTNANRNQKFALIVCSRYFCDAWFGWFYFRDLKVLRDPWKSILFYWTWLRRESSGRLIKTENFRCCQSVQNYRNVSYGTCDSIHRQGF